MWLDQAVDRCPLAQFTPFTRLALRNFTRYRQHGLLPRPGGAGDQDARLMEALDLLDGEFATLAEREAKAAQRRGR